MILCQAFTPAAPNIVIALIVGWYCDNRYCLVCFCYVLLSLATRGTAEWKDNESWGLVGSNPVPDMTGDLSVRRGMRPQGSPIIRDLVVAAARRPNTPTLGSCAHLQSALARFFSEQFRGAPKE